MCPSKKRTCMPLNYVFFILLLLKSHYVKWDFFKWATLHYNYSLQIFNLQVIGRPVLKRTFLIANGIILQVKWIFSFFDSLIKLCFCFSQSIYLTPCNNHLYTCFVLSQFCPFLEVGNLILLILYLLQPPISMPFF